MLKAAMSRHPIVENINAAAAAAAAAAFAPSRGARSVSPIFGWRMPWLIFGR